jgi:hypothetical protein
MSCSANNEHFPCDFDHFAQSFQQPERSDRRQRIDAQNAAGSCPRGPGKAALRRALDRSRPTGLQRELDGLAMSGCNHRNRCQPHDDTGSLQQSQGLSEENHRGSGRNERTQTANDR